jgi:RNA polymerase sigma factor (TIGR02999 family)
MSTPELAWDQENENQFGAHYAILRKVASVFVSRESGENVPSATSLLHQAWLRHKAGHPEAGEAVSVSDIAILMQHILVEKARTRRRRSQLLQNFAIGQTASAQSESRVELADLVDLEGALNTLSVEHPEKSTLVRLRFFGGLSLSECATVMEISDRTADRYWQFARAWLNRELEK